MKIKLITLTVVVLLSACSKEIELDQLQTRGNLVYEVNATTPFTGTVKEQYDNGQVKLKLTYKKGEKNGTHIEYYENGELKFNAKYKSGQLEGKYEEYFPNQILKKSGELVNGVGSEFHYNKDSELYKTISYENHVVTFEKFEDVNYSYIEMINLSGLPYPEDEKLKSNFLSNLDNHAAKVFDHLIFNDNECFSGETVHYPSGKIMCTTDKKTNFFYPNGNRVAEIASSDEFTSEEYFTVSGKSCGKQIFREGDEKFIVLYPDCSVHWVDYRFDSKYYLSKYHNQTAEGFIKSGHYYCYDGNLDEIYSGTDADCLEILKKKQEKERKEEEKKRKLAEEKRKLAEEKRKLAEEKRKLVEQKKKQEQQQKEQEVKKYAGIVKNHILDGSVKLYHEETYETLVVALYFLTSGRLVDWNFREFSGNSEFDQSLENLFSTINFIHELREMPDWLFDEYFIPFLLVITPEDFKNKKNWIEKTQKLPIPVHVPKPTYPFTAEVNTTEGYAIIAFTITKKGKVKDLALIKESPSFKEFGKSSMKAAKGLRFDPILVNGKPEEVRSSYKYTFQIGK